LEEENLEEEQKRKFETQQCGGKPGTTSSKSKVIPNQTDGGLKLWIRPSKM